MENKIGAFQNNELDQPLNAKPLSRLPPFPTTWYQCQATTNNWATSFFSFNIISDVSVRLIWASSQETKSAVKSPFHPFQDLQYISKMLWRCVWHMWVIWEIIRETRLGREPDSAPSNITNGRAVVYLWTGFTWMMHAWCINDTLLL